ncbi:MAG TPA: penicillin acylase family protein, partial [Polyangiaceae bacterium]|nr:penicillin acylase family protein [Polyangiaceae bacterium]
MKVAMDGLGVPEIRAASRPDAIRALGYVTARDRLFQMDLLRRKSAGRLAEILGPPLVEADTHQRLYGLPRAAAAIVARLPADQRAALDAYAQGVNGYLASAKALPLECDLLHYRPEPWGPEDGILIMLGMFQALGDTEEQERTRTVLAQSLPPGVAAFLSDDVDRYTRELLGPRAPAPPPLPADELRALSAQGREKRAAAAGAGAGVLGISAGVPGASAGVLSASAGVLSASAGEPPVGSNGWAVAGSRTADGRAILANDMHLDLGVPNIWYRARLRYADVDLTGVLLPGLPLVAVGTNRHVAWGLTSLEGDVMDLVRLEVDPGRPDE